MSTLQHLSSSYAPHVSCGSLHRLFPEIGALADAMLFPGRIVRKVEEFGRLQARADRLEATDPARAAALRQRASRLLG